MNKKLIVSLAIIISALVNPAKAGATYGINRTINFQGKLVNASGVNVPNSTPVTATFSIYETNSSCPGGGSAVWSEAQTFTPVDGIFQVQLGSQTPFESSIDFSQDTLYLGIKISTESQEMCMGNSRVKLTAVPQAFNAEKFAGMSGDNNQSSYFTITGGQGTPATLKVNGNMTVGPVITPTSAGGLTVQSNGDNTLTLSANGGLISLGSDATASGNLTVGYGKVIKPAYGPLVFQYKSGVDTWTDGLTIDNGVVTIGHAGQNIVLKSGTPAQNSILYSTDASGTLAYTATGGVGTLCLQSTNGGTPVYGACTVSISDWDLITNPQHDLSLAMGNWHTAFTWGTGTGSTNLFDLKDTTGNTGTGYVLSVANVGTSTAKPFRVLAQGNPLIDTTATGGIILGYASGGTVRVGQNGGTLQLDGTNFDVGTTGLLTLLGGLSPDITTQSNNSLTLTPGGTGALVLNTANTSASALDLNATGAVAGNAITLDTTDGGIALTAAGASNGDVTISPTDDFNLNGTAGSLINIGTTAVTQTINIGAGSNTDLSLSDAQWSISGLGAASLASLGTGTTTITAQSTAALTVGRQGSTNPAWQIDSNVANSATGLKLTAAAAGGGVTLAAISSGADEGLTLNSKGTGGLTVDTGGAGSINIGTANSNLITLGKTGTVNTSGSILKFPGGFMAQGKVIGKALAILDETGDQDIFTASQSGIPVFSLHRVAGTAANGIQFTPAATGNAPLMVSFGSAADVGIAIGAKGAGIVTLASGSTGDIQFFTSSNKITSGGALTIAGNLTTNGTTVTVGNGSAATVTTTTNAGLTFSAGSGQITFSSDATASGNLTVGYGKVVKPAYGPLTLQYKSAADAWANGLTIDANNISITPATAGLITIGATAGTGTITLGSSTGAQTVNIGTGTAGANAQTVNIGTTTTGGAGTITVNIGNTNTASNGVTGVNIYAGNTSGTSRGPSMTLGATASTSALCSSIALSTTPTAGTVYEIRDCSGNPAKDYAEMYPTQSGVDYGDIVVIGDEIVETLADDGYGNILPNAPKEKIAKLVKANQPNQSNVIGVVSLNYGDFSSTGHNVISDTDNPLPIALNGRVPVKISASSQPISAGDFLTTSSDPGRAIRANGSGYVIGKALNNWQPGSGVEKIMVYMERGYYNGLPNTVLAGLTGDAVQYVQFIKVKADEIETTKLTASEIVTGVLTADLIKAKKIDGLDLLTEKFTGLEDKMASLSAVISNTPTPWPTPITISPTPALDLTVLGTLIANNGLTVKGTAEFLNSVTFKNPVTFESSPVFNQDTVGFAVIKKDTDRVNIMFNKEYSELPIVAVNITANLINDSDNSIDESSNSDLEKRILAENYIYIVTRKTTKGFTIVLNKSAQSDLTFSWMVLTTKNPNTFSSMLVPVVTATPIPTVIPTLVPTLIPTIIPTVAPTVATDSATSQTVDSGG